MKKNLENIIINLYKANINNRADFISARRKISNKEKISPPQNSQLIQVYRNLVKVGKIKPNSKIEKYLVKRSVRTLSGVAVITVLTKPFPCPGKCIYCPGQKGMPKSYLSNEPAAMRAAGQKFDPYKQVAVRLKALQANGHDTSKIEIIVLGGSWSSYEKKYQAWFIKRCFDGLNQKTSKNLAQAQKKNQSAKNRCIGLTLETRPDLITETELIRMRSFGCTRVELGVQSVYDPILKLNRRGNTVADIINATALLKKAGFKITYHMMPNLPGSTKTKDIKMFEDLFNKPEFQPDQLKIYPCIVTQHSLLYHWNKQGKYKPYTEKQLKKILIEIKQKIPPYVRIARLVRDIPSESIVDGNKTTNLRQVIDEEIKGTKLACKCIRCREARDNPANLDEVKLFIKKYQASAGTEYFLSFESKNKKILYAFLRLRINSDLKNNFINELKNTAIVRELHTYGEVIPVGSNRKAVQHFGFGKKLMAQAEKIARKNKIEKISVIAGIGVRKYYEKLDYKLEGTYMIKNI